MFAFLINASGALIVFIYLATAAAQIRLRRRHDATATAAPDVRMWFFPWASYLAVAGMLAVLAAMALTPGLASQFYVSVRRTHRGRRGLWCLGAAPATGRAPRRTQAPVSRAPHRRPARAPYPRRRSPSPSASAWR